ncbi:hypothetical protein [Thermogemmatispora sp.]|uniref:hypothetical protein n=1 Tax=Thermogemmatispora sp. TaxID=1968838 RepID=UPI0035E45F42
MNDSEQLQRLYSRLSRRDIDEFYAGYQLWLAEQRLAVLDAEIQALRQQIEQNEQRLRQLQPSEGLANLLTSLRAWGVSDVVLLDRLCERGEEWLQAMFRRLDTCRRLGLFDGDCARWCEHALEGAYDWLDSIEEEPPLTSEELVSPETAEWAAGEEESLGAGLTEDEFLRRLLREEATAGSLPAIAPAEVVVVDGDGGEVPTGSEQAVPAEVVPLPEQEADQATQTGLTHSDAAASQPEETEALEAPCSAGSGSPLDEAPETLPEQAGSGQDFSSLEEPAIREYVSDTANGAAPKPSPSEGQEGEDQSPGEQEAISSSVGAFYEFSPAGHQEAPSGAEEVVVPEGESQELVAQDTSFSCLADADQAQEENEKAEAVLAPSQDPVESEALPHPAPAAAKSQPSALAALEEQPSETAQPGDEQGECRQEADPQGGSVMTGEPVRSPREQEDEEEDTATELQFWQRIFGRHSVELD